MSWTLQYEAAPDAPPTGGAGHTGTFDVVAITAGTPSTIGTHTTDPETGGDTIREWRAFTDALPGGWDPFAGDRVRMVYVSGSDAPNFRKMYVTDGVSRLPAAYPDINDPYSETDNNSGGGGTDVIGSCGLGNFIFDKETNALVSLGSTPPAWYFGIPLIGRFGLGGLLGVVEDVDAFLTTRATAGAQSSHTVGPITIQPADAWILFVYDHASSTQAVSPSVSGFGLTWALAYSQNQGDPGTRLSVFVGTGTPTPSSSLTVTLNHSTGVSAGIAGFGVNGVEPGDVVDSVTVGEGFASASVSATASGFATGSRGIVFGICAEQRSSGQMVFGGGYSNYSALFQSQAGTSDTYDIAVALGFADNPDDPSATLDTFVTGEWKWLVLVGVNRLT